MTWRIYALLFLLGFSVVFGVAQFQSSPGYMDADYYYATGLVLAEGQGFTEPFLWNYLDNPSGLPHPSHAYWMPMTSMISAVGMWIAGASNFAAAQWPFLLISALIPLITAALAFSFTSRRDLALISGLLAVFSGYYIPYLSTTDTFGIYMLLGGCFFLACKIPRLWLRALTFGLLAGLMHLSRADGIMWLAIGGFSLFFSRERLSRKNLLSTFYYLFILFFGYLIILIPWFVRNLSAFGTPLSPGGLQMLWLTRYDQLFSYPPGQLTMQYWLASGWDAILASRWWALKFNLGTTLGVQGSVILLPLIVIGVWQLRQNKRVQLGLFAWVLTFSVMTVIFPFAGARGGFFHSGTALQTLWWALAPLGLERLVAWISHWRNWDIEGPQRVFQYMLVGISFLLTLGIFWGRVIGSDPRKPAWDMNMNRYRVVEQSLLEDGASPGDVIVVSNPPGYFAATGRSTIAVSDGDIQVLEMVAARYGGNYLFLTPLDTPHDLQIIFENPEGWFDYLGEVEGGVLFAIR